MVIRQIDVADAPLSPEIKSSPEIEMPETEMPEMEMPEMKMSETGVREIEPDRASVRVRYVCSLAQRRFWVLERLDPGNPALNVAVRWQLEGNISIASMQAAWRKIVKRHDVLRTFFVADDGEPVQVVEPAID